MAAPKWLFLLAFLLLSRDGRYEGPDRTPQPPRTVEVRFQPLEWGQVALAPGLRLTGAWKMTASDPRFSGMSALAVRPDEPLLVLTDSGVLIELPRPREGDRASLRELPAGPGSPIFKKHRDSEALVADGGDLLVTFEFQHSLWHYGADGRASGQRLPARTFGRNSGIEAMVRDQAGRLLLLPERSDYLLVRTGPASLARIPLAGRTGGIADATRLPDGRILVAIREVTLLALRNRLAWLERTDRGYRLRPFATLPLRLFDNVEGLAAEPLPGGRTRLWAVTDNDGWRRTLLLEMEFAPSLQGR